MKSVLKFGLIFLTFSIFSCRVENNVRLPIICITFDDQHLSSFTNGLPILEKYQMKATTFVNTASIGRVDRLNWSQLDSLYFSFDWDIGGHTLHHLNLPDQPMETVEYEIKQDFQTLKEKGYHPKSFALPSGHASNAHFEVISKYYKNIRTSMNIQHYVPLNNKFLGYFPYYSEYSPDEIKGRIIRAIENKEDLIIIGFHSVDDNDGDKPTNCTPAEFEEIISWIYNNKFMVMKLDEAVEFLSE